MAFVIDESFLPATLTSHPMTDEEFAAFCAEHPDLFFEMTAEGEIIVMPPTHTFTGAQNAELIQLRAWARTDRRGIVFDSASGIVLANGARRSPDALWILKSRIEQLDTAIRNRYWHLCPDFVVELRSSTDRLSSIRNKMKEYMANGAQLGWLIDPEKSSVTIYRPDAEPETRSAIDSIEGEGPVAGFVLDLTSVWNPLG